MYNFNILYNNNTIKFVKFQFIINIKYKKSKFLVY